LNDPNILWAQTRSPGRHANETWHLLFSPPRYSGWGMEPNPLGKEIFAGLKRIWKDGSGRRRHSEKPPSPQLPACRSPFDFVEFRPVLSPLSLPAGRPPSRLPPLHAAGPSGGRAAARRLACLPRQPPLRLPGGRGRCRPFWHGFQVKSFWGRLLIGGAFPRRLGMFPKAPSVPLWPSDQRSPPLSSCN